MAVLNIYDVLSRILSLLQPQNSIFLYILAIFLIFHHFQYSYVFKVKGFHIKPGSNKPGESIIGTANREKCDLIIMGTRGLDDEKRLILGSVSDYIVHHSWIPTMVCPKASPKL